MTRVRSYLDGVLTVEALGADSAAGLFRAEDARGGVAWLARGEPFQYLHAVEFNAPGVRRGFHAHGGHRERLYVFSGTLRLLAAHAGVTVDVTLRAGDLATFSPGVEHGLIAESPAFAVSFGTGTDPITDSVPCPHLG
ncbi:MAG TPA: cupin domain-containing protein [Longimicrobium sp.]|nr:cupin domain-containing protein [Longimicrobium sp.]